MVGTAQGRLCPPYALDCFASLAMTASNSRPGALLLRLFLVAVDRRLFLHRQPDVVEAVDQAVLAERVDLEFHGAAVRPAVFLRGKIDAQRRIGAALGVIEQLVEIVLRDADREDAVLEAVV